MVENSRSNRANEQQSQHDCCLGVGTERVCVKTHLRTQPDRLWFPNQGRVPHTPGFPVKLAGVDELHAAFLNESRTRGRCLVPRTGNPGISLVFREMWDTTVFNRSIPRITRDSKSCGDGAVA